MRPVQTMLLLAIIAAVVACSNKSKNQDREILMRNYAFCRCMYYALPKDSSIHTDPSGAVFLEFLERSDASTDALDSVARRAAATILPSVISDHDGRRLVLYECLKFYNSPTLDSVVQKYLQKRTAN